MDLKNAESGSQIAENVYFVDWGLPRGKDAVKCARCGGYAPEVDSTEEEIRSELNCGSSWACCCMAFVCDSCGARMVASREAPEME